MHTNQFWGHLIFWGDGRVTWSLELHASRYAACRTWYRRSKHSMYVYGDIWLCCIQYRYRYRSFDFDVRFYEFMVVDIVPYIEVKLRYRWSKTLGLEPLPNIIPDGEVFSLISKPWLRHVDVMSSPWLRCRSHDFDIGCCKDPRIGASSEYRTLYRSFLLRYRSHDIEVMTSISKLCTRYQAFFRSFDIEEKHQYWMSSPSPQTVISRIFTR